MIKAAVIGHPISHSLSPVIHGYWFKQHGLTGDYQAMDIAPHDLIARTKALRDDGYAGFNVTVPHKQAIMNCCDVIDDTARAIGAVNTVVIKEGKIEGRNTDAFGYIGNLKQTLPALDLKSGPAVVLGAGGAARAVIYGLLAEGVPEIRLANRTRDNADALARDFKNVRVIDWDDRAAACENANLLTNTTVLGMKGQVALDMDLSKLPDHASVYDIVYKPLYTQLLLDAKARGLPVVTGIGMLLHQARPAFAAWTGIMPDVTNELNAMIAERAL